MDEIGALNTWLFARFHGDATLMAAVTGVFWNQTEPNQTMPYAIFAFNNADDHGTIGGGGRRAYSFMDYDIKAVTLGSSILTASQIMARIDTLLQDYKGNVVFAGDTYSIGTAMRISPFSFTEEDAGKRYNHHGGLYRFFVNKVG